MTTTASAPRTASRWLVAYGAVVVVDLVALASGVHVLDVVAKLALMPLLLAWVLANGRPVPRLLVAGLLLAWVGDALLEVPGDLASVAGLAFFLAMQVCYVTGFLHLGAADVVLRRFPWIVVGYALGWVSLCLWLAPDLAVLLWPVVGYSVALVTMATLAAGVSARVGIGALLFLVSDALLAIRVADHDFAGRGVLVIATYAVAQYLIADGWLRRHTPTPSAPR